MNPQMASSDPVVDEAGSAGAEYRIGAPGLDPTLSEILRFNLDLDELLRFYR